MKNNFINLKIATVARYHDRYFLTALKWNALFVYMKEANRLFYLDSFQLKREAFCMYIRSFRYKEEIWFLPAEAENIAILNINNLKIEYIPINYHEEDCISEFKYNNFIRFNNHYVCFIPRGVKEAVIINMETKSVEKYYQLAVQKEEFQNAVLIDNVLHFYPWKGSWKVSLDLISGKMSYQKWENKEDYGDAVYNKKVGNIIHAPARKNCVLIEDVRGNILKEKKVDCPSDNSGYHTFYSSISDEEIIFWGTKGAVFVDSRNCDIRYSNIREDADDGILIPIDSCVKEAYVFGGNQIFQYDNDQKKYVSTEIVMTIENLMTQLKRRGKNLYELYRFTEHSFEIENNPLTLRNFFYLLDWDSLKDCVHMGKHRTLSQLNDLSVLFSI